MSVAGAVEVQGHAEAGFETLVEVFAENWDLYDEIGAGFCLYVDGDEKVSVWGGLADPAVGRPWQEDTMAVTFSATKGVTAICVHHLAEQKQIDLDAPVARYWPEFGAAGKDNISVRWVLSHRAGLFSIEAPLTLEEVLAVRPVADALARQAPAWEPGSAHLYHPLSYGYILGELVRRVTGKTLGAVRPRGHRGADRRRCLDRLARRAGAPGGATLSRYRRAAARYRQRHGGDG